jgi:hypothetical protein
LIKEPNPQVAPLWKFVPLRAVVSVAPCVPLPGLAELTVGGGGLTTVAVMNSVLIPVNPELLATVNFTAYVPAEMYVCVGFSCVEVCPSPKSHE